jgi:hypothetical protein
MALIFAAFIIFAASVSVVVVSALVLMWAWNLVVPLFWPAAPHLTFITALAINTILSLVKWTLGISRGGKK